MADVQLSTLGSVVKTAYEGQSNTNAFTDTEKTKLTNIEAGATNNSTDAVLVARANHTGTQLMSTISDAGNLATLDTVDTAQIDNNAITTVKILDANVTTAKIDDAAVTAAKLAETYVESDPTGVTGADVVTNMMSLTQAEYNAITPNASTFYIITDAS